MKNRLVLLLVAICFSALAKADDDSTKTTMLGEPVVKNRVKREIVIPKDPFLASLLSAEMPGVGQMYCSKWLKGGMFLVGTVTCYVVANEFTQKAEDPLATDELSTQYRNRSALFVLLGLGLHFYNIIDAYKTANRHNVQMIEDRLGMRKWDLGLACGKEKAALYIAKKF